MTRASGTIVKVSNVGLRHGGQMLLDDISLSIEAGETLILLGESGAGKSLLIDILAGNLAHDGTVYFDPSVPKAARTYSYDQFAALSLLYVREIIDLMEAMYRAPRNDDMMDAFRMGEIMDKQVRVLSKGERKRVGVYAALFARPALAVLDEPTDGMDPILRRNFWKVIGQRKGATFLTTHLWEEARESHDRIALMAKGKLLADVAPVDQLVRHLSYAGKVVVDELTSVPPAFPSIVNDRRRMIYYADDTQKAALLEAVSASRSGYSVLPIDLVDVYQLLSTQSVARGAVQ